MATMTIRNIDNQLKIRLRVRAAVNGRSMEEEARDILRCALSTGPEQEGSWVDAIRARFAKYGGVELELPERGPGREPPDFSGPEYGEYDE